MSSEAIRRTPEPSWSVIIRLFCQPIEANRKRRLLGIRAAGLNRRNEARIADAYRVELHKQWQILVPISGERPVWQVSPLSQA